jgi:hypothetical protein
LVYGGLGGFSFFLVIYLQQVAGYSAFEAGIAFMPVTFVMFFLSRRFGALSMRIGPRIPMTVGPLVAGAGLLLLRGAGAAPDYATDVLPGILLFALGLSATVAPLTATVLASVEQRHAGVASGVNNAVARIAGLVAIAVVGAVVAGTFDARVDERLPAAANEKRQPLVTQVPDSVPAGQKAEVHAALEGAAVDAFRAGITLAGLLVMAGGVVAGIGVRNPPREATPAAHPAAAAAG